jgi:hypothetical protein
MDIETKEPEALETNIKCESKRIQKGKKGMNFYQRLDLTGSLRKFRRGPQRKMLTTALTLATYL